MWWPKKKDDARTGGPGRGPWWAIAGLAAIAVLALVLYTWSLSRNGMANSYYAAAAKSATVSWKAFLFGSLDPGSFITVDKPPVSIWVMALSARVFGFSSWSVLLPQALAGVASVLVLHRLVRRWAGDVAALIAALVLALTPVAVLIFRYNNPDAILTLLLLLAAWAVWSALENGSTLRLGLGGVALGFAFLTKMLMALLVAPAFVLVYLVCGLGKPGRRLLQLVAPLAAMVVTGGWWLALVELWPEATRPHVGGTVGDSWFDLVFGRSGGYLGGSTTITHMSGNPGVLRIFNTALGGQVSWFIPLALVGLVAGLWATRRAPRPDHKRAGYLLWGVWALAMIGVFGYAQGTFHSYYTVVLAPAVAALTGAGCEELWRLGRGRPWTAWLLPAAVAGTAAWSAVLLGRVSGYAPGLATTVVAVGGAAALSLLILQLVPMRGRMRRLSLAAVAFLCAGALLAGPVAYDLSTVTRSVAGNAAAAGPDATGLQSLTPGVTVSGQVAATTTFGPGSTGGEDLSVDSALVDYLQAHRQGAEFLVAVQTSAASVPIILATGEPVVTIGGYKSRDPYPTATRLEALVKAGELHYVLISGDKGLGSSPLVSGESSESTKAILQTTLDWVAANGTVVSPAEYGGSTEGTLYRLP